MNVAHWLVQRAEELTVDTAVMSRVENRIISFEDLDARSNRWAAGLRKHGIARGERTLVMVRAGIDLITLTWALFKAGAVPVLIDPGMGRRSFLSCVAQVRPTSFVGIPLAHAFALTGSASFASVKRRVTVGSYGFGHPTLESLALDDGPVLEDVADAEEAAVLFTSGSTGAPKGAIYTHGIFDAQVRSLQAIYGFQPGEIDCAAFPLFSLFDAALGMTSLIPPVNPSRPGSCDPEAVARTIAAYHASTAFGSPAVWNRVADWCMTHAFRLRDLHRVIIAGASVSPDLVLKLRMIMPGEVHTPYGATEALPVASISGEELVGPRYETPAGTHVASARGAGTCVGHLAPGMELRVIPVSDAPVDALEPLPVGSVGELAVRGPVVTLGYAGLPEATRMARIVEPDGTVWHRMGDLGRVDEEGRVWLAGRRTERVETPNGVLYTDQLEGIANALANRRTALIGVGERPAQRPFLVVEGWKDDALVKQLAEALPQVEGILFKWKFPVDVRHNAKIHRLDLAKWAASRVPARAIAAS